MLVLERDCLLMFQMAIKSRLINFEHVQGHFQEMNSDRHKSLLDKANQWKDISIASRVPLQESSSNCRMNMISPDSRVATTNAAFLSYLHSHVSQSADVSLVRQQTPRYETGPCSVSS